MNQSKEHPLYLFALTAEELLLVADISRVSRDEGNRLIGYQRPEVRRHVTSIVEYLNGPEVLFPNSIIIALSSNVVFTQMRGPKVDNGMADAGTLEIRLPPKGQPRPGWIVDVAGGEHPVGGDPKHGSRTAAAAHDSRAVEIAVSALDQSGRRGRTIGMSNGSGGGAPSPVGRTE